METGPTLPHDLVHAIVEKALGLEDGFWAAIERGAAFGGFAVVGRQRHRHPGRKVVKAASERMLQAEFKVSWAHRVWSKQRTKGRGLGSCPLTQREIERASKALDEGMSQWDALKPGEALELDW
jgi:hypothetical protein